MGYLRPNELEATQPFARRLPGSLRTEPLPEELVRLAVANGQGALTRSGGLAFRSGRFTGCTQARYIVRNAVSEAEVDWGAANQPLDPEHFRALGEHLRRHLAASDTYLVTRHAGGPEGLPVRVVTTSATHALFAQHLFQAPREDAACLEALTVLHSPECLAVPEIHGTQSSTFVVLDLASRTILIGGTGCADELKKAVFSYLNFVLPERGILPMQAAVNLGDWGDSAVFFGHSGTGKTCLSSDPSRHLLGDDEHGWSDDCIFNLEGGCYAQTIGLSEDEDPEIWRAANSPFALLENVMIDPKNGEIDWSSAAITSSPRCAYPLSALERTWPREVAPPPSQVIFLVSDTYGVLPPVARLSLDQAVHYFLSSYSAGSCDGEDALGAPFMPRPREVYALLFRERVEQSGASVWLVNTGWFGGPSGEGFRIPIEETRCILRAILSSSLELGPTRTDPYFDLAVPTHVPGVSASLLEPRSSWNDVLRYDRQALTLRQRLLQNLTMMRGNQRWANLR